MGKQVESAVDPENISSMCVQCRDVATILTVPEAHRKSLGMILRVLTYMKQAKQPSPGFSSGKEKMAMEKVIRREGDGKASSATPACNACE